MQTDEPDSKTFGFINPQGFHQVHQFASVKAIYQLIVFIPFVNAFSFN